MKINSKTKIIKLTMKKQMIYKYNLNKKMINIKKNNKMIV